MPANRVASIAGWLTLAAILVFEVALPAMLVGQRVTGAADRATIEAYYGHPELLGLGLAGMVTIIAFLVFAVALREVLGGRPGGRPEGRLWANVGLAAAVVAAALLLVRIAGQMALVRGLAAGSDILPIFLVQDFIYNGALYAAEATYPIAFALALAATGAAPRWYLPLAILVGAMQLANMTSLVVGLPDAVTLPGNIGFAVWLGTTANLVRRVAAPDAQPV